MIGHGDLDTRRPVAQRRDRRRVGQHQQGHPHDQPRVELLDRLDRRERHPCRLWPAAYRLSHSATVAF